MKTVIQMIDLKAEVRELKLQEDLHQIKELMLEHSELEVTEVILMEQEAVEDGLEEEQVGVVILRVAVVQVLSSFHRIHLLNLIDAMNLFSAALAQEATKVMVISPLKSSAPRETSSNEHVNYKGGIYVSNQ